MLDRNIKIYAAKHHTATEEYRRGQDISNFPIEQVRLEWICTLVIVSSIGTVGYGLGLLKATASEKGLLASSRSTANVAVVDLAYSSPARNAVPDRRYYLQHLYGKKALCFYIILIFILTDSP